MIFKIIEKYLVFYFYMKTAWHKKIKQRNMKYYKKRSI